MLRLVRPRSSRQEFLEVALPTFKGKEFFAHRFHYSRVKIAV